MHVVRHQPTEPAEEALGEVLQRSGDGEDGLKKDEHRQEEDRGAEHGVQHHRVDPIRALVDLGQSVIRRLQHRVDPPGHLGGVGGGRDDRLGPGIDSCHDVTQVGESVAMTRHHRHHRHSQCSGEGREVEPAVAACQIVGEGQHHADRQPRLLKLCQQSQGAPQCRRIEGDQQGVRDVDAGVVVVGVEDVDDDLLVGADRVEAVGAREVFDDDDFVVAEMSGPFEPRDGDAGVVARLRVQSGQGVEQRGLAGVGAADDGEPGAPDIHRGRSAAAPAVVLCAAHRTGSTWMLRAWTPRSAIS